MRHLSSPGAALDDVTLLGGAGGQRAQSARSGDTIVRRLLRKNGCCPGAVRVLADKLHLRAISDRTFKLMMLGWLAFFAWCVRFAFLKPQEAKNKPNKPTG